jgi:hypothetical protein
MLRTKVVCFLSMFLASIVILVCKTRAPHAVNPDGPEQQVQLQAAPVLQNAAVSDSDTARAEDLTRFQAQATYGNLPLSFEPNRGQTDPQVKFLSRAGNRTVWLIKDEVVIALARRSRSSRAGGKQEVVGKESRVQPAVLRMRFVGANTSPRMGGESRQQGTVNYFIGKPEEWRTQIPTYARVRYSSLYPGIDLVFYGNKRELEYDLVVSPGGDPAQIKIGIAGAESLRLDADGNLVMKTPAGDVVQQKPRIYQSKGAKLIAVAGDYVIKGNDEVGFRLGSYDREAAVVIDPVLRYASYLTGGGDEDDVGTGIAVDSSNQAVVSGWTCSVNFPGQNGPANNSCPAAFVTKFNVTGTNTIFTAFIAGSQFFDNNPVALDAAGNVYVGGSTFGNTFGDDTFKSTPGAFQETFGGKTDAWVVKLNSTGARVIYATFLGGDGDERTGGLAVDSDGNAYVTGSTTSKNFPVTTGAFQRACKLKNDGSCASAFVIKLNSLGARALYSSYLGGHGTQSGQGIALNDAGNALVTGQTDAKDFPTTAGTDQPVIAGKEDAFVTQFSASGSHLNFSTFLGGSGSDAGSAIALDSNGNVFITGSTASTDFPIKNAFKPHCSGGCSFASKLSPSLRLIYSTFLGNGEGTTIAVTPVGQAYVAGDTGTNFQTTQTAFQRVLFPLEFGGGPPTSGIFITKLSPTGQLNYATLFGGSVESPRIALDASTNAYLTGEVGFSFGTIPVTPGAFQTERGPELDAFVAKVVALCALSTVNRTVTICSPGNGSTVKSPVRIIAGTTDVTPVKLAQIYLDGKKIFEQPLSAINVALPIAGGTHRLTVQAFDTNNVIFKETINITVGP